jgi:hypothetical protein
MMRGTIAALAIVLASCSGDDGGGDDQQPIIDAAPAIDAAPPTIDAAPPDAPATTICDTGLSTQDPDCDMCLGTNCCTQFNTCLNDVACSTCLQNPTPSCDTNPTYMAVDLCAAQCQPVCE